MVCQCINCGNEDLRPTSGDIFARVAWCPKCNTTAFYADYRNPLRDTIGKAEERNCPYIITPPDVNLDAW